MPEVRALLDRVRGDTVKRISHGLAEGGEPSPVLRTAVRGWLGFMDGACLDWVEHRDVDREDAARAAARHPDGRRARRRGGYGELISSMSTTNTSVSFGPIGPEPLGP